MRRHPLLAPIVLALAIVGATAMAAFPAQGSALWLAAPLVLALSILVAPLLSGGSVMAGGIVAISVFVACSAVMLLAPAALPITIAIVGGGTVAILDQPHACRSRRRAAC